MYNINNKILIMKHGKMYHILMKKTMKKIPFQKLHKKEFKRIIMNVKILEIKMQKLKQEGNSILTQNKQFYPS
jgi:hypothetical protein